ncbi:MAG: tetratricopeptide repeat protein [Sphingobacteriales bacterium]|nr:MAG: tetratricopeptide repeat protein [Sphingobacteriales bacterium]
MRKLLWLILLTFFGINARAQPLVPEEALGFQYYQQGEYDKALVIFEKLFASARGEAYFDYYFTSLLKLRNFTEAEKLAKKMIRSKPGNPVYNVALGRVYLESNRKAMAEKTFQSAIDNLPKDEFKIRDVANAFYKIDSYDIAAKVFKEGRRIMNNEQLFTFDLLAIYRFKKDKEMLVQEYVEALAYLPEVLFQAQSAFAQIFEGNADYQVLQGILLKKIQKFPDKEIYTDMLVWQFIQQKEYEMALRQLIAQDKRVKGTGSQIYTTATTFAANLAFTTAIKAYEYLITKGKDTDFYLPARVELVNTKYQLATAGKFDVRSIRELADQYDAIIKEYGSSIRTLFAIKRWANLQAYYLNDLQKAQESLESALTIKGLAGSDVGLLKIELGDIYVLNGEPWEALLLYEQVSKEFENTIAGKEANFKAAKLSFYQGNFTYAKSQADVLKSSTSQLIANDALNLSLLISDNLQSSQDSLALKMYADAEMLQFRNMNEKAISKLDSIPLVYPGNSLEDDILLVKSKIYIKAADFAAAAVVLTKLKDDFRESIWTDDAIFTLAGLYETHLNDAEKARSLYQSLITEHPGSMYTAEARKRFRILRGDAL